MLHYPRSFSKIDVDIHSPHLKSCLLSDVKPAHTDANRDCYPRYRSVKTLLMYLDSGHSR